MDGMLSFAPETPLEVVTNLLCWHSQANPMKLEPRQTTVIAHVILSPPLGVISRVKF